MTALLFRNARLIDPERGTDEIGEIAVRNGLICAEEDAGPEVQVVECGTLSKPQKQGL